MDKEAVLNTLIRIMELELAGAVRCMHYARTVHAFNRLPIVAWLKMQAEEAPVRAHQTDEPATWLGGRRSLSIGPLPESRKRDAGDAPREPLGREREALKAYRDLLDLSRDKNLRLEEYAHNMIAGELAHQDEVGTMSMKRSDRPEEFRMHNRNSANDAGAPSRDGNPCSLQAV